MDEFTTQASGIEHSFVAFLSGQVVYREFRYFELIMEKKTKILKELGDDNNNDIHVGKQCKVAGICYTYYYRYPKQNLCKVFENLGNPSF